MLIKDKHDWDEFLAIVESCGKGEGHGVELRPSRYPFIARAMDSQRPYGVFVSFVTPAEAHELSSLVPPPGKSPRRRATSKSGPKKATRCDRT